MSDYYNEGNIYNSNIPAEPAQLPPREQNPPQAPQMPQAPVTQVGYAPQAPQTPQVPQAPQAPRPAQAPPQPPMAPTYNSNYGNSVPYRAPQPPARPAQPINPQQPPVRQAPPQQYAPPQREYYRAYQPQAAPMSSGLKTLLIVIIAVLGVSLIGMISYVSLNSGGDNSDNSKSSFTINNPEEKFYPTIPEKYKSGDESEPSKSSGNYSESDYSNRTEEDFEGIKLNKKPSSGKSGTSFAFKNAENSVVSVICYVDGQEGSANSYTTMGTGIIVTEDGYIVTNAHIVNNSRTAYLFKVITGDKKEYKAGVVGYDGRSDLAVLKIDAEGLKPATFGDSSELEVTEDVIVVGNPLSLNYQNSVTKGIVSAVERQVSIHNNVKYIQTDAAINPGNSGGPLCNMYGQVVGVTSSKIANTDYEGMGFAIPSKRVKAVCDEIIRYGYVRNRVRIGITGRVAYYNDTETAIEIQTIDSSGPMEGTGAEQGDYIIKVDGKKVANFSDIYDVLESFKEGDKVKVTLYRPSTDKTYDITVTLQADKP